MRSEICLLAVDVCVEQRAFGGKILEEKPGEWRLQFTVAIREVGNEGLQRRGHGEWLMPE